MKRFRRVLLGPVALAVLGSPAVAAAETYHVAPGGDDAATGLAGAPWASLQHAADTVAAGDTVLVAAGTYAGFYQSTSGTAGQPIVWSADAGVVIDQENPVTNDGINLEGASYVTVEGFTVEGTARAGIRAVLGDHVTLRRNVSRNNFSWGILTGFCDNLLIERNETSGSVDEHGIYVSNSGDNPVIRWNVSHDNNANGIHMNGDVFTPPGDGIISNALVEGNVIYGNGAAGGSGINCDGVQSSRIVNNLVFATHASGISLYRIDGGGSSTGNVVVNNTVLVAADGRWALNIQDASTDTTVYNNILLNAHASRGSIDISADSLAGFASDFNVLMDRMTIDGGNVLTLAAWQAATQTDASSLVALPAALFANAGADDYHLSPTSPAIDVGTATEAPSIDLEGTARPYGAGFDIGAYEWCGGDCGGAGGSGAAGGGGPGGGSGAGAPGGSGAGAAGNPAAPSEEGGCSCELAGGHGRATAGSLAALAALGVGMLVRRRRRAR